MQTKNMQTSLYPVMIFIIIISSSSSSNSSSVLTLLIYFKINFILNKNTMIKF